jgi:hypothetical protein
MLLILEHITPNHPKFNVTYPTSEYTHLPPSLMLPIQTQIQKNRHIYPNTFSYAFNNIIHIFTHTLDVTHLTTHYTHLPPHLMSPISQQKHLFNPHLILPISQHNTYIKPHN